MARILLINRNDFSAKDGATKSLYQLYVALKERNIPVDVMSLKCRKRICLKRNVRFLFKLIKCDVVLYNSISCTFERGFLGLHKFVRLLNKKCILYFRENHIHLSETYPNILADYQKRNMYHLVNDKSLGVFFVSHYSKRSFCHYFNKEEHNQKYKVVYNGVALKAIGTNASSKQKHIVAVGSIQKNKGYDFFIQVAQAIKIFDSSYRFTWYGEGQEETEFRQAIKAKQLDDVLSIAKYKAIEDILQECSAVAITGVAESFSRVAIEAILSDKKLLIRDSLEGTIEISLGCGLVISDEMVRVNPNIIKSYLESPIDYTKKNEVAEKYSMPVHCKRILDALEA